MPNLMINQLDNHLTNPLAPLYVLHGDEYLLMDEACMKIRLAAKSAGFTDHTRFIVERNFNWADLFEAQNSMGLFADKQVIEVRFPSAKLGKEGSKYLQDYCHQLHDDAISIVWLPYLNKEATGSAWFNSLMQQGQCIKIGTVSAQELPNWIKTRLQKQNQSFTNNESGQLALKLLCERTEGNLLAAQQEILKLALLYPEQALDLEMVQKSVANVARYDVFSLATVILSGDVALTTRLIRGLEGEGEAANLVLWSLSEEIRNLVRLKHASLQGENTALLMRNMRIWGEKETLVKKALPRLPLARLHQFLEQAAILDQQIKGLQTNSSVLDIWSQLLKLARQIAQTVKR